MTEGSGSRAAKKSRQRKTHDPCPRCGLNRLRCLCSLIPELKLETYLTLVIHAKELKRTTNSGRLAIHAMPNSQMIVRGAKDDAEHSPISILRAGYHPLLFFPADDAIELSEEFVRNLKRPVQLIVPDGNWRQASKVHSRISELASVTRVKISTPNEGQVHLRAEHRPEGMSTLEAIARAIGILESREAEQKLLMLYSEKLIRTILGRGTKLPSGND